MELLPGILLLAVVVLFVGIALDAAHRAPRTAHRAPRTAHRAASRTRRQSASSSGNRPSLRGEPGLRRSIRIALGNPATINGPRRHSPSVTLLLELLG